MPSIDVRPRVNPGLVRGTGYRGGLTSVYERVHARERVEHEAERVSRPLGEVGEGRRRYTAYLAV